MLYLIIFALYAIVLYVAQKMYGKWPFAFWGLVYVVIFTASFLMGARDNNVGTDIGVYGYDTWRTARSYMGDFWEGNNHVRREPIFFAINYLAAFFSGKFGVALFLIQFVMMALQAHALKRYMDIVPLWLSTLFFNLYFFNLNLNLMCQGVACAFFLWSLKFYETREFMKLLLCAVVCFFIHKSSSVAYFILFGFAFIVGRPVEKQPRLLILLALACVGAIGLYIVILDYLTSTIPVLGQYAAYGVGVFESSVSTLDVLMRFLLIAYAIMAVRLKVLDARLALFAMPFFIVDLAIQFLGAYAYFATRIGYYFFVYEVPLTLVLLAKTRMTARSRYIVTTCLLIFFTYYCIRFNFVRGDGETYPYSSEYLDTE